MAHPKQIAEKDVVEAAMKLVEKAGPGRLSLRGVAHEIGVKAPSLYHYFKDKTALEVAVVEAGNRLLLEKIREAVRRKRKKGAFVAMAVAYLGFARDRPVLYAFMAEDRGAAGSSSPAGVELWRMLLEVIDGISGSPDDTPMAVAMWSFLHGFATLERTGKFGNAGVQEGFAEGLEALFAWCQKSPAL